MTVIPALGKLRQNYCTAVKVSLGYNTGPVFHPCGSVNQVWWYMPETPAFHSRRGGKGIRSSKSFPVKQTVSVRPTWDVKILARGFRGGEEEKKSPPSHS